MRTKSWLFYKIIVLYCFLASGRASMTLGDNQYVDMLLSLVGFFLIPRSAFIFSNKRIFASSFLALAAMYTMHGSTLMAAFAQFFMILIPIQVIFLRSDYQIDLFRFLTKWYAILLILSVSWWLLWILGMPLPHFSETLPWQYNDYGYILNNYVLFRHTIDLNPDAILESVMRFNGFFLEPGHIGSITSLFLFINRFNLRKWYNIIFLLVIVLSFSAAAYFLTILAFLMYVYSVNRKKIVLALTFVIVLIGIAMTFNDGDNPVGELIIGKMTRESGAVEGRFSYQTQKLWDEIILNGDILFGLGADAEISQSAGYKVFLILNGIFGAILTITAYWLIVRIHYSSLGVFLFYLLIVSFLQRTYCFWDAFLDPYILGITVFKIYRHGIDKKSLYIIAK